MCACLRRLQYCTNEYSPEVNHCHESKLRYIRTIPKNAPFIFLRAPGKGNNGQVKNQQLTNKTPMCVVSIKYGYLGPCCFCLHIITQKVESAHWQLPRKSSCCVPMLYRAPKNAYLPLGAAHYFLFGFAITI